MNVKRYFFFLLIIPLTPAFSQRFEFLGVEQGLSQMVARAVVQDKQGFLWVGTWDGLNRYDGYSFVHYRNDPNDSLSISENSITSLFVDSKDQLWIQFSSGKMNVLDPTRRRFTLIRKSNGQPLSYVQLQPLVEDRKGNVWGVVDSVVFKVNISTFVVTTFDTIPTASRINDVQQEGVWFTDHHRLLCVTNDEHIVSVFIPDLNAKINSVYTDRNGIVWLLNNSAGLQVFDPRSGRIVRHFHGRSNPPISAGNLYAMIEDSRGAYWVATDNGLYKLMINQTDEKSITVEHFVHDPLNETSLRSNIVFDLIEDYTGVLWIGTQQGLTKLPPLRKKFQTIPASARDRIVLRGVIPVAIYEFPDSTLWIGTTGNILEYDLKSQSLKRMYSERDGLSSNVIYTIFKDSFQRLWIGTKFGLNRYDPARKRFIPVLFTDEQELYTNANRSYAIAEGDSGILWVGTTYGLVRYLPATGEYRRFHFPSDIGTEGKTYVLSLFFDNGTLWVGTNSEGLVKFNTHTFEHERFFFDKNDPHSLSHNKVMAITKDRKGNLWIGTLGGGINQLPVHHQKVKFRRFQTSDGLPNNNVYGFIEDEHEYLWFSSNNGLTRMNLKNFACDNFSTDDGLPSPAFIQNSYHRGRSGRIYFGCAGSIVAFYPDEISLNTLPPRIAFTDFKLFNVSHPEYLNTETLVLPYDKNFFGFEFTALSFESPQKNQFAYKLSGLREAWVHLGTQRAVDFSDIRPGEYTLTVIASNNDGIWNKTGITRTIIITPPFWDTVWFRIIATFVVIMSVLITANSLMQRRYRARIEQLEKEKLLMEERQRVRDKISSDLHDDLASTVGSAGLFVEAAKRSLQTDLERAKNFLEKATGILNEAEMAMNDIIWSVSPKYDTFEGLAMRMRSFAHEVCDAAQISVHFRMEGEPTRSLSDHVRRAMYLIFKEAVFNTLKHSRATTLEVAVLCKNSLLELHIKDNGIGFSATKESLPTGGHGLNNIRKRASAIHADVTIRSEIHQGTEIQVQVKLPTA